MKKPFENLLEINRNENGDYYFIYEVKEVKNHIRPGSKSRNEVIIVGVPQKKLISYLQKSSQQLKKYPEEE